MSTTTNDYDNMYITVQRSRKTKRPVLFRLHCINLENKTDINFTGVGRRQNSNGNLGRPRARNDAYATLHTIDGSIRLWARRVQPTTKLARFILFFTRKVTATAAAQKVVTKMMMTA